jgi:hypothetical protein
MKKTQLTFLRNLITRFVICMPLLLAAVDSNAQCSLGCNSRIQVSLDSSTCSATITPMMMLGTGVVPGCPGLTVEVRDNGVLIPGGVVTFAHVGKTLEVKVKSSNGNSCWGYATIEYKFAPVLICPTSPITATCDSIQDYLPTLVTKCDTTAKIQITDLEVRNNDCNTTGLAPNVVKTIRRSFIAVDKAGRTSAPCVVDFSLTTINSLDSIKMPTNLIAPLKNFSCEGDYKKDDNLNPHPDTAGVPTLKGIKLWPTQNVACNLLATYSDVTLPRIGCVTKIMRTWKIIEWSCNSPQRTREQLQMIEITDSKAPTLTKLPDMTVSTNADKCNATVNLPAISATDNCSKASEISYSIFGGPALLSSNGGAVTIPVGKDTFYYRVQDVCGNIAYDTIVVTVADKTPPVAICNSNIVIALSTEKTTYVNAAAFNGGSYDECSPVTLQIRRMDSLCVGGNTLFGEKVAVCCEDVANGVMVVLRATDASGNRNDCMVNAQVQDKVAPIITCPTSRTVNCATPFNPADLKTTFGNATATDNCSVTVTEKTLSNTIDQCQKGRIVREFAATDDGGRRSTCSQTINFVINESFNYSTIKWPKDTTISGCGDPTSAAFSPNVYGKPTFPSGSCQLVGIDFKDQAFTFNNVSGNACFKILRTWTVIDWCNFNGEEYYTYTYQQTIKVENKVKPIITSSCAAKSVCTFDQSCQSGYVELSASATDDCTRGLKWFARIDPNNTGRFVDSLTISGEGTTATASAPTVATASGNYPIGNHRVQWSFEDKCGNITVCDQLFSVVNCKAPTPYLINGLAVNLMPVDTTRDGIPDFGMISIWAKDFDLGSSHPCGQRVYLSFSNDIRDTGKVFTCKDIGKKEVTIFASILSGTDTIRSSARTTIDIQNNNKACGVQLTENIIVSGKIATESNQGVASTTLTLAGLESSIITTNEEGVYKFPGMPTGGTYSLSAAKDGDYTNGVSTLDLVMMQRHILGLQKLTSPYLYIAADVNNDKKITTSDLVELRKLILGVTPKLENVPSWKFVDQGYTFRDIQNTLNEAYNSSYDITKLDANMDINFVAVKMGDINKSAATNANSTIAESRSSQIVKLNTNAQSFIAGEDVSIKFTAEKAISTTGLQFTLRFDPTAVEFKSINGNDIQLAESNLGLSRVNEGIITLSWNNDNAVNIVDLLEAQFVAKKNGNTSEVLKLTSDLTKAELYNDNNEVLNLALENKSVNAGFELFQNSPNPFNGNTNISFVLPVASQVDFKVYDVTGKVLKQINREYTAGKHTITLERSQLGQSGILYYQLEAGEFIATKKMVVID